MKKAKRSVAKPLAQVGALPMREFEDGQFRVLLVTTRTTGRWTIPKGWPIKGRKAYEAAAQEAMEEAGVGGKPRKRAVARYLYWKRMGDHFALCRVKIYAILVTKEHEAWPEQMERRRFWFSPADAAEIVEEPGLKKALKWLSDR